jgi:hypothetical protein
MTEEAPVAGTSKTVVQVAGMLVSGALAKKAVDATWRLGAGRKPPSDPTDPDVAVREAVLWAVLSGAAVGLARMMVDRRLVASARRRTARKARALTT